MKKSVIFIWLFEKKMYFTIYHAKHKKKIAPNLPTMRYHFIILILTIMVLIDFLYRNFL